MLARLCRRDRQGRSDHSIEESDDTFHVETKVRKEYEHLEGGDGDDSNGTYHSLPVNR